MEEPTQTSRPPEVSPPYFPFRTLTNLLVRMEAEGEPRRIDRGYLSNMAGGTVAQFITGLRSLGLINEDERPQPLLRELIEAREDRPAVVARIVRDFYPWANELGEQRATHQELEEAFRNHGPTGSTLRKAIAFYLQAAKYAGIPVSPFFKEPRTGGEARPAGPRRTATPRRRGRGGETPPPPTPEDRPRDEGDPAEDRRNRLFEAMLKKFEAADNVDDALLDRLERIAGTLPAEGATRKRTPGNKGSTEPSQRSAGQDGDE